MTGRTDGTAVFIAADISRSVGCGMKYRITQRPAAGGEVVR